MEAPKLSGYTRDQRWYEMNAKSAAQDVTKPESLVELSDVRAKILTADKSTIFRPRMTACTTANPVF